MTTAMLEKAGDQVRLMERKRLNDILAEQKLGASGLVDETTAVQMGKLIGCRFMITGKITRFAYKKSGFSSGWGTSALLSRIPGVGGLGAAVAGDVHISKATFTGRLDCRLIDIKTGEILAVAKDEGTVSDVGVKVAGTGNDVQYDQELVNKIFEPVVDHVAVALAKRLTVLIAEGGFEDPPPDPNAMASVAPAAEPVQAPPPPQPVVVQGQPQMAVGGMLPFMMPAGTGVETVDPGMLKALLPDSAAGSGRRNVEAEKAGMGTFKVSHAQARYGGVALKIMDLGGVNTMGMLAPWATLEQDKETDDGYEKMGKVNGRQVHEKYSKHGQNLYRVIVANRFLVEASGSNVDLAVLRQVVNSVGFQQLEAMRNYGVKKPGN